RLGALPGGSQGQAGSRGRVQRQVQQQRGGLVQVAGAFGGAAAVGQVQDGFAGARDAAVPGGGGGFERDAARTQALGQRARQRRVAMDRQGIRAGVRGGQPRLGGRRIRPVIVEAASGLAPQASAVDQFLLQHGWLEARCVVEGSPYAAGNSCVHIL